MDSFAYDIGLRHERVKQVLFRWLKCIILIFTELIVYFEIYWAYGPTVDTP